MSEQPMRPKESERAAIRVVAESGDDPPVLMLNLNRYSEAANFPNGEPYRSYMAVLGEVLSEVGGRVLWQHPIYGQPVGDQAIDEVLAIWYPSHQAFLDLQTARGGEERARLRQMTVEDAVIHRCPGDQYPFEPN